MNDDDIDIIDGYIEGVHWIDKNFNLHIWARMKNYLKSTNLKLKIINIFILLFKFFLITFQSGKMVFQNSHF